MSDTIPLNRAQREANYEFGQIHHHKDGSVSIFSQRLTSKQLLRLRHKSNKAKGDAPNSRSVRRWRRQQEESGKRLARFAARQILQERRAQRDPQSSMGEAGGDVRKPLCLRCFPSAPDWSCRTASGKKTKDHAGRIR